MMWRKEGLWGSSKYYRRPNRSLAKDDKCWGRWRNKCYPSFQSQGSGGALAQAALQSFAQACVLTHLGLSRIVGCLWCWWLYTLSPCVKKQKFGPRV